MYHYYEFLVLVVGLFVLYDTYLLDSIVSA